MTLTRRAEATACHLLAELLPRRWARTQGVAAAARNLSGILGEYADLIEAAAWLHDIGYSPAIAVTGFHPIDGARHLRDGEHADDLLCRLVAHHSFALNEAVRRGLGDDLAGEFPAPPDHLADAITYCDMTTGPDGQRLTVNQRLAEIRARDGPDHPVSHAITASMPQITAAVAHITERIQNSARRTRWSQAGSMKPIEGTGSDLGAFNVRGAQLLSRDYLERAIEAERLDDGGISQVTVRVAGILSYTRSMPGSREHNGVHHTSFPGEDRKSRMADGDVGSFDTRFERLTDRYKDAILRGELKPGDRFPSARELSETHGVGRTTAGRVHGTLISLGLIEHRAGIGTFVLGLPAGGSKDPAVLRAAAQKTVQAFDDWTSRSKPQALADAIKELRRALG